MPITNIRQNNRQNPLGSVVKDATFYPTCLFILRGGKKSVKTTPFAAGKIRGIPSPKSAERQRENRASPRPSGITIR
jgi:hypothetical protein